MNSGTGEKVVADGRVEKSKVLQEVLADLKKTPGPTGLQSPSRLPHVELSMALLLQAGQPVLANRNKTLPKAQRPRGLSASYTKS